MICDCPGVTGKSMRNRRHCTTGTLERPQLKGQEREISVLLDDSACRQRQVLLSTNLALLLYRVPCKSPDVQADAAQP
jgi:hypothetical protein